MSNLLFFILFLSFLTGLGVSLALAFASLFFFKIALDI